MTSLRSARRAARLTQAELASRAGVSRQLVGAVEAGRHLPRVDAAIAIAAALSVDVSSLFAPDRPPADVVSGAVPGEGTMVRASRVGDSIVTAPVRVGPDGWDLADGVVADGALDVFGSGGRPGFVVAGCEPGLQVLERMLRDRGLGAVAAMASSAAAVSALAAGRSHAAVVHGPDASALPAADGVEVERYHLAGWLVGLAAPPDVRSGWWREALSGRAPVVQREAGAGVQQSFLRAVGGSSVAGPRSEGHLDAVRRALLTGLPAVTIEPAALAVGAAFHPIEAHTAELWVGRRWAGERPVIEALTILTAQDFQRRLAGVGGYDLAGCGARAA